MSKITGTMDFGAIEVTILIATGLTCYVLVRSFRDCCSTPLKGPSSTFHNFFFGVMPYLRSAPDAGAIYEEWASEYGEVFSVPGFLGSRSIIFTDPKTIAHFAAGETYGYVSTPHSKRFSEKLMGRGIFWAEGDSHKRQHRALNPAFSNAAIKDLTYIFFDSAYKVKAAWDVILEAGPSEGTLIEVQLWMNHISLDTIGLAGFAHNFGALSGKTSQIAAAFNNISSKAGFLDNAVFLSSFIIPILGYIPTGRRLMLNQLTRTMSNLGDRFLATSRDVSSDKSVIGLLVKSASAEKFSHEEVKAQINTLLIAGYETTAISLTWALLELLRNPAMQIKLREELVQSGGDPMWEELTNQGSFLGAVTCEVLRLHPPKPELRRMAAEDDILPLSAPIETADGKLVDTVFMRKGTVVTLPVVCINRSEAFWGSNAKEFNPARWLGDEKHQAQEL
ncbi:hypothetical protein MVEN_02523900 [Mycena venus]|uniref:Cytochrome P450 n=1 Tax=Mycena venus TaxID=2733690 RepID=A0A8H6WUN7_9AGAR|nr:hypothetical protein MVEN_02523900 [Mycena venus]